MKKFILEFCCCYNEYIRFNKLGEYSGTCIMYKIDRRQLSLGSSCHNGSIEKRIYQSALRKKRVLESLAGSHAYNPIRDSRRDFLARKDSPTVSPKLSLRVSDRIICTRKEFLREILYNNIAITAFVEIFGNFSHIVE